MFFHIFKYKIKYMTRDKSAVFWLILFPIIMSLFFYMSIGNKEFDKFETIHVAILDENNEHADFLNIVEESDLFNITITSKEKADTLLAEGEVAAIIDPSKQYSVTVGKNGINESITKFFLDTYTKTERAITDIVTDNPAILQTDFINQISTQKSYLKEIPLNGETNHTVIYYYALIAMASLMGCTLAISDIANIQANQSPHAARLNIAPTHKLKTFLATISATILFHFLICLADIAFITKVLGVDFGNEIGLIVLITFVGCFTGIMIGALVSSLIKGGYGVKVGLLIGITMFGVFLSGMMSEEIKYIVSTDFPFLSYINPANLITDALYALYYYPTTERYFLNLSILSVFGIVCAIFTYFILRRQKYASI